MIPAAYVRHLPLAFILLVALLLRGCALDDRPMHADEANQAIKLGLLLDTSDYFFDPEDHHGPTLYYFARPVAWLCGNFSTAELTAFSVRLTPALFGVLTVYLTALLAAPLGRIAMVVAAAFVAVAPATVYFSRYFIQEPLLLAFTLGALVCGREWLQSGHHRWAVAMGICAGLMQATKALAPVFAVAALIALWMVGGFRVPPPARWRGFAIACVAAAVTAAAFYSSFGSNPRGAAHALSTLGTMFDRATAGASGHEKPFWYYGALLTQSYNHWPEWRMLPFAGLALIGYFASWRSPTATMRFLIYFSTIVAAALSFVSYKTPWVVIHLVPLLAIFAASNYELPLRWRRIPPVAWFVAGFLAIVLLASAAIFVAFTRPADPRNPHAYVHSSPDVTKIRGLVQDARRAFPGEPVRVIAPEYWPIPWYLRDVPRVGYYTALPQDCDGAIVIAAAEYAEAVQACLIDNYTSSFVGLRPGVLLVVFTKSSGNAP